MPEPEETQKTDYSLENLPKSKDEWSGLAKDDPEKFTELTQARYDQMYRQNKEYEEKLSAAQERERNLQVEVQHYKQIPTPPPTVPTTPVPTEPERWGFNKIPKNDREWDEFFLEDPNKAAEVKYHSLSEAEKTKAQERQYQQEFSTTRQQSAQTVQDTHPDMYLSELDEQGKPKTDGNGKLVLKRNKDGDPIFNPNSEKGKLWVDIFNEDPQGFSNLKNAPTQMMAEMERRLRIKGTKMMENTGQDRQTEVEEGQLAPDGVPPPRSANVKFSSEEERAHAQAGIRRGLYKDEADYCRNRDEKNGGIYDKNSTPQFG